MADGRVVITVRENAVCYGYFMDNRPCELYAEPREQGSLLGNIYAARIEKVADGIHGAFMELDKTVKAYYPMSGNKHKVLLSSGQRREPKGGDIALVQVTKDAQKGKQAVVDDNITLEGKYIVMTLGDRKYGISKKIRGDKERKRLKKLLEEWRCNDFGVIIRTNAQGVSKERLMREFRVLGDRRRRILKKGRYARGRTLLYEEPGHYITLARSLRSSEVKKVITDDPGIYKQLRSYYEETGDKELLKKIKFHKDDYSLWKLYRFGYHYEDALKKHVWLNSGGSLVIDHTEAMTVIDVNSGSMVKNPKKKNDLFYRLNCEAATEIARQLRLRNLSGIILIDFINMDQKDDEELLLEVLREECAGDRVSINVVDMTALGFVELTRSKSRKPLREQMFACGLLDFFTGTARRW